MQLSTLARHLAEFQLDEVSSDPQRVQLTLRATALSAHCPRCQSPSASVHSYSCRTVA